MKHEHPDFSGLSLGILLLVCVVWWSYHKSLSVEIDRNDSQHVLGVLRGYQGFL